MCKANEVFFVECPKGSYKVTWRRGYAGYRIYTPALYRVENGTKDAARCARCDGAEHAVRRVEAKYHTAICVRMAGEAASKCDERCLRGKRVCNCKCMGRCHGAGFCACNLPVAAPVAERSEV